METLTKSELVLDLSLEISINSGIHRTFDAMLARLAELGGDGGPVMHFKLEPWPGGRWYRDLGDNNGHLWGHVQVIKRPALLEIVGPMFMSYPVISHMQFRVTEKPGGCVVSLRHRALGFITEEHRNGVSMGWTSLLKGVRDHAER